LRAVGFLLQELLNYIFLIAQSDEYVKIIYNRLRFAYHIIASNCLVVAVTCYMFGFWDMLFKKTTYIIARQLWGNSLGYVVLFVTISGITRHAQI
jgi:hypothetical protein